MKGFSAPCSRGTRALHFSQRSDDETHFPALEDPSRAYARISRPDENRRRPQGPVGPPGQGARAACRLTHAAPARHGAARYRLSGAAAFEAVFRSGRRFDAHFLQLIAAPAAHSPGRVGYVIARKSIRNAVDRNRLRRRLRESVRAVRPAVEAFDLILRVRRPMARTDIALAHGESRRLLARLVEKP
jgi:ribonuclease P protein component